MAGNRVTDNVGGNLSIETKQERKKYLRRKEHLSRRVYELWCKR